LAQKKNQLKSHSTGIVSWIVFLVTISLVLVILTTVIFPVLILGSMDGIKFPVKLNIFETGLWAYPVIITNIIVFSLAILYFKNKLPSSLTKLFLFIFNFEVSKRVAFYFIVAVLAIYVAFSIQEVFAADPWIDYARYVLPRLENWTPTTFTGRVTDTWLVFAFGNVSDAIFGNYAVSAFLASIALLVLTYLITLEITKKRFAGLVAMVVLLQSGNFLIYDTTITYPNFWVVFLILSLYTIYKKWPFSPFSFVLAIPSKIISALYLPVILFFVYRAQIPKQNKIRLFIIYGVIAIVGLSAILVTNQSFGTTTFSNIGFDQLKFFSGFVAFSAQFRFDGLILMFMLPLTVGLFIASRNGIKEADSIMVLMSGVFLLAAMLPGFTAFTNNPYRFAPFLVFFAMGVGTLLSRRIDR